MEGRSSKDATLFGKFGNIENFFNQYFIKDFTHKDHFNLHKKLYKIVTQL